LPTVTQGAVIRMLSFDLARRYLPLFSFYVVIIDGSHHSVVFSFVLQKLKTSVKERCDSVVNMAPRANLVGDES
jgi:hypothetical protein